MPKAKASRPSSVAPARQANAATPSWKIYFAALVIVLAGLAAYSNSFHGRFINDDRPTIEENSSIKQGLLESLQTTDGGETSTGRPVLNLSLALNYELNGLSVEGYHVTNLAVHLLAGLILFGLVRRTLEVPGMRTDYRHWSLAVALATALLWTLHPLQTNSVTYIVQRAEALMGLFYLLSLYCFVRAEQSGRTSWWLTLAVIACGLSAMCKEVAVTIPVMILLYDRTFMAGSFAEAWRRRWPWYLALGCTWVPLGVNVWASGTRGNTAGFGIGLSWWTYAVAQFRAIFTYLELSVWPHPLVLDYGTSNVLQAGDVWPYALALAVVAGGTFYALWRSPKLGFLGAWFFVILAPSSSVIPVKTELIAEQRMYLPLAALIVLAVVALYSWAGRRAFTLIAVVAIAWGWLTFERNQQYQSLTEISQQDVATFPTNGKAHYSLATGLFFAGRVNESIQEIKLSLALDPWDAKRENTLGYTLALTGQTEEALLHYRRALDISPDYVVTRVNLGNLLKKSGQLPEAIAEYLTALHDAPESAEVRVSLGNAYNAAGQPDKALAYYQSAVARKPTLEQAHLGLGNTLALFKHWDEATKEYEAALKLEPKDYLARYSLGEVLVNLGNTAGARQELEEVLREQPDFAPARNALNALPTDRL